MKPNTSRLPSFGPGLTARLSCRQLIPTHCLRLFWAAIFFLAGNVALAGTATIALTGSGGVPGVAGANFGGFFFVPLVNNNGNVAFFATMQDGVGGVNGNSNGNAQGIWGADGAGNLILIARQNSGGVPGQPSNNFSNINSGFYLNNGGVGFTSQTTTNVVGIWSSNSTGSRIKIPISRLHEIEQRIADLREKSSGMKAKW